MVVMLSLFEEFADDILEKGPPKAAHDLKKKIQYWREAPARADADLRALLGD